MNHRFKTIESVSEGLYKEKGSKFLAFAHPIHSIEQAKGLVKQYKKQYFDARHHCFAYQIEPQNPQVRTSDDGEPNNTAGIPILGQIYAHQLCNVLVVVVRYFGGTKLGTSGLVTAYKSAAQNALHNASIVERNIKTYRSIQFPFIAIDGVMRLIKNHQIKIIEQEATDTSFVYLLELDLEFAKQIEQELGRIVTF